MRASATSKLQVDNQKILTGDALAPIFDDFIRLS